MEILTINNIIVAITCLVSILCFSNHELRNKLAHYPVSEHGRNEYYRMLSSGFIHADPFHLFVNMFVLYQFGGEVESYFIDTHNEFGKVIYLVFYLIAIVVANMPTFSRYKNNSSYMALGASGATSAVLFAFILYRPMSMLGLFLVIPIPAIIFGILYLWYSSYASRRSTDNIDHDAHFYGAVFGFLFAWMINPGQITSFLGQITDVFNG